MNEDWERIPELDRTYLMEKQREEEEWWQEECQLPAEVKFEKRVKDEIKRDTMAL